MGNLLTLNYWFNMRAGMLESKAQKGLIIFCLILAISALACYLSIKLKKTGAYGKLIKQAQSLLTWNFLFGIVLLFFTYEMIPFLSSRFWFLLWLIEIIAWTYLIVGKLSDIPRRKEELEREKEFKKYIP